MHRLRFAVPAVALALALPAGAAALSPIPTVPLYATGSVLSCHGDGGCAYVLTVRHEDWGPEAIELELVDDGSTITLDGTIEVPVGTLAVTVDGRDIPDAVENGRREVGPTFVRWKVIPSEPPPLRIEIAVEAVP